MKKYRRHTHQVKGSILILATWALFFLSSLALLLGFYIRPQVSLANKLKNRTEAHYYAQSGVKRALGEISQSPEKSEEVFTALNQTWNASEDKFKNIALGENGLLSIVHSAEEGNLDAFKYGLVDEESKININTASLEVIQKILELSTGISDLAAKGIAESMVQWRGDELIKGEGCKDNDYYKLLDPPYSCKRKNFEILEELMLVKGMTRPLFNKIKNRLTIYGSGAVNINTADRIIFQSIGVSNSLIDKIIYLRKGIDEKEATADDHIFKSVEKIINDLSKDAPLTPEEDMLMTELIKAGIFSVNSEYFSGTSIGEIKSSGNSDRIVFIINRIHEIKFWREE